VTRNELLRHVFILGPTGTGKSTLLLNLLLQIQAARVPFMVFDFKRNYRCLIRATGSEQLIVFTVGRTTAPLAINALAPPTGVEFEEWAEALSDIISTSYLLLQGARNVLKEALLQAHAQHDSTATLTHAYDLLARELDGTKSGSRRYGWLESSTRSLEELTKGSFGRALNATNPTPVAALLLRSVVFELQGFGDDQKRFFCLLWLEVVLLLRKNSNAPREQLQHVLVFDEGHNVFPRERPGEVSIPARLAREVREFGEAIIAATQQADVSESLIANSGFKLILRCDYPKDVAFASQLLQIDARWLPKLPMGTGIARLPVRFYSPILFTFSMQPIKNLTIADAEIATQWHRHNLPQPASPAAVPSALTAREEELLHDVARQPISTITDRYTRLGWNAKTGNATKDALIEKGYATFDPVTTPTGQVKILSLTAHARELLERAGITLPRLRHGGPEHEYWKFIIAERLRTHGFSVTIEYALGRGTTVDLYAARGDEHVFVEVETGRSDIPANAAKLRDVTGCVLFVFTDARAREEHAATIRAVLPTAQLLTTAELHELP
jgi:energy-coupling factor transporter ATP-binding protein EcfA2